MKDIFHSFQIITEPYPASYEMSARVVSVEVKQPEPETDPSIPFSAEFKNCVAIPPLFLWLQGEMLNELNSRENLPFL